MGNRAKSKAAHNKVYVYGAKVRDKESAARINELLWQEQNQFNFLCGSEIERRDTFRQIRREIGGKYYCKMLDELEFLDEFLKNFEKVKLGKYNFPETRNKFIARIENLKNNPDYEEYSVVKKQAAKLREKVVIEEKRINTEYFEKLNNKILAPKIEKECKKVIAERSDIKKVIDKNGRISVAGPKTRKIIIQKVQNSILELKSVPKYYKQDINSSLIYKQRVSEWTEQNSNKKTPVTYINSKGHREIIWKDVEMPLGGDTYSGEILYKALEASKDNAVYNPNFRKSGDTRVLTVIPESKEGLVRNFDAILNGDHSNKIKMSLLANHKRINKKQNKNQYYNIDFNFSFIGLEEDKFVRMSIKMHRPLPEDAIISRISLVKERIGKRNNYSVQFLVQSDLPMEQQTPTGNKIAAVRFCYTKYENRIRFATVYDGKNCVDYFLPEDMWKRNVYIQSIQQAADNYFDQIQVLLKEWNKNNRGIYEAAYNSWHTNHERTPKSFAQSFSSWNKYSPGFERMIFGMLETYCVNNEHKVAWKLWKKERKVRSHNVAYKKSNVKSKDLFCQGNEESFETISEFLKAIGYKNEKQIMSIYLYFYWNKNTHLLQLVRDLQRKLTNWKLDYYRKWAVELARNYGHIKFGEWDMSKTAKKKSNIPDIKGQTKPETVRQFAGIYRAKSAIKVVFNNHYTEIDIAAVPKTHIACGGNLSMDNEHEETKVKCATCGKVWNISNNLAMQIYNSNAIVAKKDKE